jgi:hypothetical protein
LRPFLSHLLSAPGSLLRLVLALLAPLRLGPSSKHATIPTSRHRSSQREQYDLDERGFRDLPHGDPREVGEDTRLLSN